MLKIGIIGFGKMGQVRARTLESSGRACVEIIYDENDINQPNDYVIEKNIDEIINNSKLEALFICTPNFLNKQLTIQALEAGKHVFCEKPPAFNSGDVEEIMSAEEKSGKMLMYGFNHRHHDSIKHMKKLINSGEYGKVIWMRGRYGKSVDKAFFNTWRAKKEFSGGGILLDQGIHMLDLFIMFGGPFDSVKAEVSNFYWNLDIEDNVFAIYKNSKTNVVASLHSTMTQWRHLFSLEVFLEKGYMVLNGLKTSSGTYGDEILSVAKNRTVAPAATWEDEDRIKFEIDNSWESEINQFLDSIENQVPIKVGSSKDALAVMQLIDKTYKNGD